MDGAGRATLIGTVVAALVSLAGALLARYGKRDDTATERQRLADDRRQKDIDTIIDQLRATIARFEGELDDCKAEIKQDKATIEQMRTVNAEVYGDKQQLSMRVQMQDQRLREQDERLRGQDAMIGQLRARVAELEGKVS